MKTSFIHAQISDLPKIVDTYNSTIASRLVTADLDPVSIDSKVKWFYDHNADTRPLWIVKVNDKYAGWMSFQNFYGRPAYSGTAEVSIYLNEDQRGKGLGKECLRTALSQSPTLKIHTVLGFIFGHNEPSLKLFYQFGFEKWASFPEVANMDGIYRDLLILGKKI